MASHSEIDYYEVDFSSIDLRDPSNVNALKELIEKYNVKVALVNSW